MNNIRSLGGVLRIGMLSIIALVLSSCIVPPSADAQSPEQAPKSGKIFVVIPAAKDLPGRWFVVKAGDFEVVQMISSKSSDEVLNVELEPDQGLEFSTLGALTAVHVGRLAKVPPLVSLRWDGESGPKAVDDATLKALFVLPLQALAIARVSHTDEEISQLLRNSSLQRVELAQVAAAESTLKTCLTSKSIVHLELNSCESIEDQAFSAIGTDTKVRVLRVTNCKRVTDLGIGYIGRCTKLETLALAGLPVAGKRLDALTAMKGLQSLSLRKLRQLQPGALAALTPIGNQLRTLEFERLANLNGDDWGLLKSLSEVRRVAIDECAFTDSEFLMLGELVKLEELKLSSLKSFSGRGFASFKSAKLIRDIDISRCLGFSAEALREIPRLENLRKFRLVGWDGDAAGFVSDSSQLTKLEELDVSSSTAFSLTQLRQLCRLPKLRKLVARSVSISKEGLQELAQSVKPVEVIYE